MHDHVHGRTDQDNTLKKTEQSAENTADGFGERNEFHQAEQTGKKFENQSDQTIDQDKQKHERDEPRNADVRRHHNGDHAPDARIPSARDDKTKNRAEHLSEAHEKSDFDAAHDKSGKHKDQNDFNKKHM